MFRVRFMSDDYRYLELELRNHELQEILELMENYIVSMTQTPIYDNWGWVSKYRVYLLLDRPVWEITPHGDCEYCESYEADRFMLVDGRWLTVVCESCGRCYFCDQVLDFDEAVEIEIGGVYYLAHCDCLPTCSSCGETSTSVVEAHDGSYLCESCAYFCNYCEAYYSPDEFCDECNRCHNCCTCSDVRSEPYNYSYKPNPVFFKLNDERPDFYLGLELEVEAPDYETQVLVVERIHENLEELYCKADGSLGSYGFEIVSHPLTYAYATKMLRLRGLLEDLKEVSCTSYSNKRCGLHIHISRNYFTSYELATLGLLVSKLMGLKAFKSFIQRTNGQIENWCAPHNLAACIRSIKEKRIIYDLSSSRYRCVNYQNENTIEFRIFRGTLKTERVLAYLQFVISCAYLVKQVSASYFINHSPKDLFLLVLEYAKRNNYKELVYYFVRGYKKWGRETTSYNNHGYVVEEVLEEIIDEALAQEMINAAENT